MTGSIAGSLTLAFGLLALALGLTDATSSPSDRSDEITGAIFIAAVGLTVLVPCLFFLVRSRNRTALTPLNQGGPGGTLAGANALKDLSASYVQWLGWCQREIGGDAVALHAATMAAMAEAAAGNSALAGETARRAASLALPTTGEIAEPSKIPSGKVRQLARLAAGTLPLLEDGERVVVSVFGVDRQSQIWQSAFGVIGYLIAASQGGAVFMTVTDRRVIALTGPQLTSTPSALAFAIPRSMVAQARLRRGLLFNSSLDLERIDGGRIRMRLSRAWAREGALVQRALAPGQGLTPLPPVPNLPSSMRGF